MRLEKSLHGSRSRLLRRYAVVGHPVAHSLSPVIHAVFATHEGVDLQYSQMDVEEADLESAVRKFFASGGDGLNVTLPHKQAALQLVDHASSRAEEAGAVNWLAMDGDDLVGDNTDGSGLVRDLQENLGLELSAQRILILGAGGAARGILGPLLDCAPMSVTLANRTPERAKALAEAFAMRGAVAACGLEALGNEEFNLILNATASAWSDSGLDLPKGMVAQQGICYDLMYGPETDFQKWAKEAGCECIFDGLGMLLEQAAESFNLWHGARANVTAARAAIRGSQAP